jgi:hypothetical protein
MSWNRISNYNNMHGATIKKVHLCLIKQRNNSVYRPGYGIVDCTVRGSITGKTEILLFTAPKESLANIRASIHRATRPYLRGTTTGP